MPLISIIIPTYNRASCIRRAIESILKQTFNDYEILICDDCSIDNTKEIVLQYVAKGVNIKWFENTKNSGPATARNLGINNSSGKYIAFLDSDDEWHPNKLEIQVNTLVNTDDTYGLCLTGSCFKINGTERKLSANVAWGTDSFKKLLLGEIFFSTPSLLIKKNCILEVGSFNPLMRVMEDYDLLLRLLHRYNIAIIDDCFTIINYEVTSKRKVAKNLELSLWQLLKHKKIIHEHSGLILYLKYKARLLNIVICAFLRERSLFKFIFYSFYRFMIPVLPTKKEISSTMKSFVIFICGDILYGKIK